MRLIKNKFLIYVDKFSFEIQYNWGFMGEKLNKVKPEGTQRISFCIAICMFGVILL